MSSIDENKVLIGLKQEIEKLKRDSAIKEGERNSILETLKKEFGVESIEEAKEKLDELGKDIEAKRTRREDLLTIAKEKLAEYRR